MSLLKDRAEEIGAVELGGLTPINSRLSFRLDDYLSDGSQKYPMFLTGLKGDGKTFHTIKSLGKKVIQDKDFLPAMVIYKNLKLQPIDPLKIASRDAWGERYEKIDGAAVPELMKKSNAFVLDDIHWRLEAAVNGKDSIENIVSDMNMFADQAKAGKKVIMISEDPISCYAEIIGDSPLDEVLPRFGQMPYHKFSRMSEDEWKSYEKKMDYMAFREVPELSFRDWSNLLGEYKIDSDHEVNALLYVSSQKPRSLVRFAKLFPSKDGRVRISNDQMYKKAMERIKEKVKAPQELLFNQYLMVFPELQLQESGYAYNREVIDTIPSIEDSNKKLQDTHDKLGYVKKICSDVLQRFSIPKDADPMDFLRSWAKENDERLDDMLLGMAYDQSGIVKDYITNAAIPQFMQSVAEYENTDSARAKGKNKIDLDVLGSKLKSGLQGTPWRRSNATSYYQNFGTYYYLRRPIETAFGDVLYENSTLDVLKGAKKRSHS